MFLQVIYMICSPPFNDAETLASLLGIADKYDAEAIPDAHKDNLPSMCIGSPRRVSFASLTCISN